MHTNQRRSQCERPKEKKTVLRQRKEVLGPPARRAEHVDGESWFHSAGPIQAKARVLAIAVLARRTRRSRRPSEHSGRSDSILHATLHKLPGPYVILIRNTCY